MRPYLIAIASLLIGGPMGLAQPGQQQQGGQNQCAAAAYKEYNAANLNLTLQNLPMMSVEATIEQRRLQENYCVKFARCVIGDPNNQTLRLPYLVAFDACLRDETLEKYDAVVRKP